ncbi:MAG: Rnf-Nqr domain containing protein, partial [Perlucidibaca sp.]
MSDKQNIRDILLQPILNTNPVIFQVLGICSALAVTSSMKTELAMSVGLTVVTAFSN